MSQKSTCRIEPREWQVAAMDRIKSMASKGADSALICGCPGSGKTYGSLFIAKMLSQLLSTNKLVVLTPSNSIKTQWIDRAAELGIVLEELDDVWDLHQVSLFNADVIHGYVINYQQVSSVDKSLKRFCEIARPIVILDEVHHVVGSTKKRSGNGWGTAVEYACPAAAFKTVLRDGPEQADMPPEMFDELVSLWEEASGRKVHPGREHITLASIRRDGGTQSRAQLDDATVAEYAERLAELPPVTVYHDGDAYWLADGFHRVAAHERAGAAEVLCDVRQGSRRDAVLHSVGANADHGLRRTTADKQRAVELLLRDEKWGKESDRWIADKCCVHHDTVAKHRARLVATGEIRQLAERKGRDGKTRKLPSKPKPPQGQQVGPTRQEPRSEVGDDGVRRMPEVEPVENVCEHCGSAVPAGQRFCNNNECWRQSTEPTRAADPAPDIPQVTHWEHDAEAQADMHAPLEDPRQVDMFEAPSATSPPQSPPPPESREVLLTLDHLEAKSDEQAVRAIELDLERNSPRRLKLLDMLKVRRWL